MKKLTIQATDEFVEELTPQSVEMLNSVAKHFADYMYMNETILVHVYETIHGHIADIPITHLEHDLSVKCYYVEDINFLNALTGFRWISFDKAKGKLELGFKNIKVKKNLTLNVPLIKAEDLKNETAI